MSEDDREVFEYQFMTGVHHWSQGGFLANLGSTCSLAFQGHRLALPVIQSDGVRPAHVTMTELGQHAGNVIENLETGIPALLSKRGSFVAALIPLDPSLMDQLILRGGDGTLYASGEKDHSEEGSELYTLAEAAEKLGLSLPSEDLEQREVSSQAEA